MPQQMPIDFFQAPDGVHVWQSFVSPTVYLDHWALRMFSDELDLQTRFVDSLRAKGGTLLLSNLSLNEFAGPADPRHCDDAEAFLERLLPNIYLTDFALDKVLEKEEAELDNANRLWPPSDLPQLKFFAERMQDSPPGFTMHGFIRLAHLYRDELSASTNDLVRLVRGGLDSVRGDPAFVAKARRVLPNNERTRTWIILGELLRGFVLDPAAAISDNDIIDLV
jgi:hypothetical protein